MYEVQTTECGGIPCTEYRYEPEVPDDRQPEFSLVCGQCDYYTASKTNITVGHCTLTEKARRSCSLACPEILVTSPF